MNNHTLSMRVYNKIFDLTSLFINSKLFRFSINKTNYSGENTGFNSTLIDSKTLNNVNLL